MQKVLVILACIAGALGVLAASVPWLLTAPSAFGASPPRAQSTSAPAAASAPGQRLPPPPLLSARDINRLKLYELRLDGPPEPLQVRFLRKQGQTSIEDLIRRDIENQSEPLHDDWPAILQRGRPDEKLRLIVRETGVRYAERIEIRNHPDVINTFRRQVLPLIERGCGRCHAGPNAESFRFPAGSRQSQAYVYTLLLLLAEGETRHGPLINRSLPERSALLTYMLPPGETSRAHPPLVRDKLLPPIRSRTDPNYQAILDWIAALRVPKPQYDLDYAYPDWLQRVALPAEPLPDPEPDPAAPQQPGSQPSAPR